MATFNNIEIKVGDAMGYIDGPGANLMEDIGVVIELGENRFGAFFVVHWPSRGDVKYMGVMRKGANGIGVYHLATYLAD